MASHVKLSPRTPLTFTYYRVNKEYKSPYQRAIDIDHHTIIAKPATFARIFLYPR